MHRPGEPSALPDEQDTEASALAGSLGRSEAAVRDTFRQLDDLVTSIVGAVDRRAIRRDGEWVGRSYKIGRRLLIRVDPKGSSLRVQVGADAYAAAPEALRGNFIQRDWIVFEPQDVGLGLSFLSGVMRKRACLS